eukprot:1138447-Pelagomonas_calceolata.AAC.1
MSLGVAGPDLFQPSSAEKSLLQANVNVQYKCKRAGVLALDIKMHPLLASPDIFCLSCKSIQNGTESVTGLLEQVGCRQSAGEAQEAMRDNQCMKTVPTPPTPRLLSLFQQYDGSNQNCSDEFCPFKLLPG